VTVEERLAAFPRLPFATIPTPLERLERLGARIGLPGLLIKRDDLTGLASGGNKARKLEYIVADAKAKGCDWLVTTRGRQSNHARMTAAAAAKSGMGCTLVLGDPDPGNRAGNLLLDELFGAEIVFLGDANLEQMAEGIAAACRRLEGQGHRPYDIPVGGSSAIGELGYVEAVREFAGQIGDTPLDTVVIAVGSCGTAGGLTLGLKLFLPHVRMVGISVSRSVERLQNHIADKANEAAELLGVPERVKPDDYYVTDAWVGPRYGVPTDEAIAAIRLMARTEGILLDPVYTGKSMAGLIGLNRDGFFKDSKGVCFWHTGGLPALFAFEAEMLRR
jgi:D-cysteine desulfhydrase